MGPAKLIASTLMFFSGVAAGEEGGFGVTGGLGLAAGVAGFSFC